MPWNQLDGVDVRQNLKNNQMRTRPVDRSKQRSIIQGIVYNDSGYNHIILTAGAHIRKELIVP